MSQSGEFLGHFPCPLPDCGSSDALGVWRRVADNGKEYFNGHCFSCGGKVKNPLGEEHPLESVEKEEPVTADTEWNRIESAPIRALSDRGINETVATKYGVKCHFNETNGEISHHFYPYQEDGKIIGWKVRGVEDKSFYAVGSIRHAELFGQSLFSPGGRMLVITEGECDAMAAYQMFNTLGKKYSVVSLVNGGNVKSVKENLEYVESFAKVIICLDQDKVGKSVAPKIAELLTPGKAFIMSFEEKDANDMLKNSLSRSFFQALNNAREYRPDGIIVLRDSWDDLWRNENVKSIPYPWDGVNEKLYGIRQGELVTLTSGSGMGKSAVIKELEYHIFRETPDDRIGILALEENIGKTSWGLMSIAADLPLHIREHRKDIPEDKIREWFNDTVGTGRFVAYDHFGSTSEDNLISQVRYLIKGMDCKWIFLDHLSIVVSSMAEGGDERRTIDSIMTRLRTLVEETGVGMFLVSHLRRMSGDKGHEQGGEVSLSQLRGSHAIAQLSDCVIALERNGQDDNEKMANMTKVRVLKNRYSGLTGLATNLYYHRDTGRLEEIEDVEAFLLEGEELGF